MSREQRKFGRLHQPFEVRYRLAEVGTIWETATTVNLSAGGMRIRVSNPIESDTTLELQLQVPGSPHPMFLKGVVVWTQWQAAEALELGVEFRNLTLNQQLQLDQMVHFLSH
jgi:hypothetical protein